MIRGPVSWFVLFSHGISASAVAEIINVPADLNCDGIVDSGDLAILLGAWGPCP